jgi:hypothetical protein
MVLGVGGRRFNVGVCPARRSYHRLRLQGLRRTDSPALVSLALGFGVITYSLYVE